MTSRARKVPELPANTTISANDLFIIEKVVGNTSTTCKITGTNVRKSMVQGPFADDSAANTAGVSIGELYYNGAGDVKVRLS